MSPDSEWRPLPRFGEWDETDPASYNGFSFIFEKARDERKTAAAGFLTPDRFGSQEKGNGYKQKFKNLIKRKLVCCW